MPTYKNENPIALNCTILITPLSPINLTSQPPPSQNLPTSPPLNILHYIPKTSPQSHPLYTFPTSPPPHLPLQNWPPPPDHCPPLDLAIFLLLKIASTLPTSPPSEHSPLHPKNLVTISSPLHLLTSPSYFTK